MHVFLAFGQAVKEIDCAVAKVVIEMFFKTFNEENTSFLYFLHLIVSENIRTSNDEIFLTFSCETLEICGDCHTYVFDVQVQGLCCAR